jgi:hypothetical protein
MVARITTDRGVWTVEPIENALDDLKAGRKTSLSTPNRIVWCYLQALRRRVRALQSVDDENEMKEDVALCLMQAIAVVEVFLNVFFRVVVEEPGFSQHKPRLLKDLKGRRSLEYKLKDWPAAILGKAVNFEEPAAKAFLALKERRNGLMHFTSSHESVFVSGVAIHGLADTTNLDRLTRADAVGAVEAVEGMIYILLRARGISEQNLPHALHSWTGKIPLSEAAGRISEV